MSNEVTGLLHRWRKGDESALNDAMPLVYNELRRIARTYLRRQPEHTRGSHVNRLLTPGVSAQAPAGRQERIRRWSFPNEPGKNLLRGANDCNKMAGMAFSTAVVGGADPAWSQDVVENR